VLDDEEDVSVCDCFPLVGLDWLLGLRRGSGLWHVRSDGVRGPARWRARLGMSNVFYIGTYVLRFDFQKRDVHCKL